MSNSVDEAPSAVGMTGVQDYGVEGAAEEAGAGPGSHRGDTSGHHGEPLMATEDELEAFMDTYEDILAAADQYEPLKNAGQLLVDAFAHDPPRLCGELLRFCKSVVAASAHDGLDSMSRTPTAELRSFEAIAQEAAGRAEVHMADRLDLEEEEGMEHLLVDSDDAGSATHDTPDAGGVAHNVGKEETQECGRSAAAAHRDNISAETPWQERTGHGDFAELPHGRRGHYNRGAGRARLPRRAGEPTMGLFGYLLEAIGIGARGPPQPRRPRGLRGGGGGGGGGARRAADENLTAQLCALNFHQDDVRHEALTVQLCALNFHQDDVRRALISSHNDPAKAQELLTAQSEAKALELLTAQPEVRAGSAGGGQ
ncbi:hypothetical protein T484DRAFT_1776170, partial [Baffinella frigidus]